MPRRNSPSLLTAKLKPSSKRSDRQVFKDVLFAMTPPVTAGEQVEPPEQIVKLRQSSRLIIWSRRKERIRILAAALLEFVKLVERVQHGLPTHNLFIGSFHLSPAGSKSAS